MQPIWKLAAEPQDYIYSSDKFYYEGIDEFGFLESYMDLLFVVGGWSNNDGGGNGINLLFLQLKKPLLNDKILCRGKLKEEQNMKEQLRVWVPLK